MFVSKISLKGKYS